MATKEYSMITLLGATAGGKTGVAAALADRIDAEIISADSRQVYRQMTIGTGKDIDDYRVGGKLIPYHLIDIVEPGYKYSVYEFQRDCLQAMEDISQRGKKIILCGGSGMYIEAILKGYKLVPVAADPELRAELESKSLEELVLILASYKSMHNVSDMDTKKRAMRAIEIARYYRDHPKENDHFPTIHSMTIGIKFDRESRRRRITQRLEERMKSGMVEEVESLLRRGLTPEQLLYYGLEYKYITQYLTSQIDYQQMFASLNTAIHQFAKRQMTWFRKMEKEGTKIHWIDGYLSLEEKLERIISICEREKLH
ncbi:MAG: tRNA (adenosine(37)-N6)-dimethylallyltransferase MiaA [Bacteroidales bacterium]|nr:tRNA (adenosine(37)-N6)-dimethylallyltransferase MiaA [Bacteroidales bacterium]MCF8456225.1 tRNA (adenosine(37)-N6)-dimethylallyltransferase MiaA [Bacteroidales bacterium]